MYILITLIVNSSQNLAVVYFTFLKKCPRPNLKGYQIWISVKKKNSLHEKIWKIHTKIINLKNKLAPTWNEEFELPDESYSVLYVQDYFE